MNAKSPYAGACFILTTKHAKSVAIAPPFWKNLGVTTIEYVADTDTLGTFSGERARTQDALSCARTKCEWAFSQLGGDVAYALASEASFGPHPFMPFLSCHTETLYFIDKRRDFHLFVHDVTQDTNFASKKVAHLPELLAFAQRVNFPSHSLIVRPNISEELLMIFKGIDDYPFLEQAFWKCKAASDDGYVLVETDMRASCNPTRMGVIARLAENLSTRLASLCPACDAPGWGRVGEERGLPCGFCGSETDFIQSVTYGCVKCAYTEKHGRPDDIKETPPMYCNVCNP